MSRQQRRPPRDVDRLALLLVMDVVQRVAAMEEKPPVTIGLMAGQAVLYFR